MKLSRTKDFECSEEPQFYLKLSFNLESCVIIESFHVETLEICWGFCFVLVCFNKAPAPQKCVTSAYYNPCC